MTGIGFCAICQTSANMVCSRCRKVSYCSREHQKLDWKDHRMECGCFKVMEEEGIGRYLVATRFIQKGEEVICEEAMVSGPLDAEVPLCLGCYALLNGDNLRLCMRCGSPLCSVECEKSENHQPECEILWKYRKSTTPIDPIEFFRVPFLSVFVLRCLFMRHHKPRVWEKIMRMDSRSEERKGARMAIEAAAISAGIIKKYFKYNNFTNEEIFKLEGIVQTNSFRVKNETTSSEYYEILCDIASMFQHDCLPNCSKDFMRDGKLLVTAGRDIQKGEKLTISRVNAILGTPERQRFLLQEKFLLCKCERCLDPTELGLFSSAIRCLSTGCQGYLVPHQTDIPTKYQWICTRCKQAPSSKKVDGHYRKAKEQLLKLEADPRSWRAFVDTYKDILHENHSLLIEVKICLIKYYTSEEIFSVVDDLSWLGDITRDVQSLASQLTTNESKLVDICNDQLNLLTILEERDQLFEVLSAAQGALQSLQL